MTVTTPTQLDNIVRAQYHDKAIQGYKVRRLYDGYAMPMPKEDENFLGTSYNVSFMHSLAPTETVISQVSDINPQAMTDSTASVTPTSFADAIQFSELMKAEAYTNLNGKGGDAYFAVGQAMTESLEVLAKKVALAGSWVRRSTARASLDAGTATHNMSYAVLLNDMTLLQGAKAPWFVDGNGNHPMAIMSPAAYNDLLIGSSEPLLSVALYQDKSLLMSGEAGMLAGCRLTVSPFAHVFGGAGAANGTAVSTTLNGAVAAGDTSCTLTSVGSLAAGMHLNVGSTETAATLYPTTERVEVVGVSGSVATIVGSGPNGGFRFAHATLSTATNADDVYPVLYGGPQSLAKIFASNIHGPNGWIGDPQETGLADQWISIAYKFYGNYGIIAQNRLMRREVSAKIDA